ncbi:TetR/AcrR family transcriptional regulator [Streptomyces avicenniae]|uniref:TetR/AcrR family transcriptional regulator n=1 Tax=Streptomyces avicenniae TaxID=500153 RepID=UPI00069C2691|nr:TetR/AcrR family transcriptional regulator [Streptomyces avicenniae]
MTPSPSPSAPQRSHARSNRARILEVARRELGARPDATLDEIAQAADVARRTLYGHFPGRDALLDALADDAAASLVDAVAASHREGDDPEEALVRFALQMWRVGDRYRMLLSLGRRHLGERRFGDLLAPAYDCGRALLERGQEAGRFARHLPPPVMAVVLRDILFALWESIDRGELDDDETLAAVTYLVTVGVPPGRAGDVVRSVRDRG